MGLDNFKRIFDENSKLFFCIVRNGQRQRSPKRVSSVFSVTNSINCPRNKRVYRSRCCAQIVAGYRSVLYVSRLISSANKIIVSLSRGWCWWCEGEGGGKQPSEGGRGRPGTRSVFARPPRRTAARHLARVSPHVPEQWCWRSICGVYCLPMCVDTPRNYCVCWSARAARAAHRMLPPYRF